MRFALAPLASALALALAATPVARAQDASNTANTGTLGEVTVGGSKPGSFASSAVQVGTFRDQSPLDVPLTSNVITREVIDAQGTNSLYGVLRNTAGVTRSQLSGSTYDNVAVRGILVENRGNYRLNGSLPIINLVAVPLENKERVEVLKGASSLYYGFVPPSGIVNYVTKRAGNDPVTSFATSINEYGAADVHVDLGRRFGDSKELGIRVNALRGKENIGINNFAGGRELFSTAVDYRISPAINLKFDAEYYRKSVSEQAAIVLPTAVGGVITLPPRPGNRTNLAGEWQRYTADAVNLLARADVAFNSNWSGIFEIGQAKNTRDRRFSQFTLANVTTGAGTLQVSQQDGQSYQNDNLRLEVAGRVPMGSMMHDLSFGYTENERGQDSRTNATINFAQNLYNPVVIPYRSPTYTTNPSVPSKILDKGLYVFDRLSLNEQWQVMVGARRSDYKSVTTTTTYTAKKTSPSVSLMYKPVQWTSVYASYIEGMEESGTAPAIRANSGEVLPPSLNKQTELGVKAEVAQGLLLQGAYFDVRRQYTTTDTATNRFVVGGLASYKGFEFAASGEISRQWAVVASALFMNPKIIQSTVANELGMSPENAPKRTYSLFGEYRPDQLPGWSFNAGWYYTGKRPVNNANQAFIDGYDLLSAGVRYRTRVFGANATFQANIENLTDKNYWSTAGNGFLGVGTPRTLRVAAKFDF